MRLEQLSDSLLQTQQSMVETARKKLKIMEENNDIAIMAVDVSTISDAIRARYYTIKQKQILDRLEKESKE
jgi:endonuclease III-like uncharacterized protein